MRCIPCRSRYRSIACPLLAGLASLAARSGQLRASTRRLTFLCRLSSDPNAPTLRPVITSGALQGALTAEDTAWACETNKGFTTETQSWYSCLADGSWIMVQIIFSVTG